MSPAHVLRRKLEGLGALFTVIEGCLLVTAPAGVITAGIRDRIAQERRALMLLLAEPEDQHSVPADPAARYWREVMNAALDAGCRMTGSHVAHGSVIVTLRFGRTVTGVMLIPGNERDAMVWFETLKRMFPGAGDPALH